MEFELPDGTSLPVADGATGADAAAAIGPGLARAALAVKVDGELGEPYKVELIEDLVRNADPAHPVDHVSLYTNGNFTDLCRGPHTPSTKRIKAFKLQSVAGAYWRGDANRQMLTRVYGTAFFSA